MPWNLEVSVEGDLEIPKDQWSNPRVFLTDSTKKKILARDLDFSYYKPLIFRAEMHDGGESIDAISSIWNDSGGLPMAIDNLMTQAFYIGLTLAKKKPKIAKEWLALLERKKV